MDRPLDGCVVDDVSFALHGYGDGFGLQRLHCRVKIFLKLFGRTVAGDRALVLVIDTLGAEPGKGAVRTSNLFYIAKKATC